MRIGIDARWIYQEISGIGSYTRELLRHLPALGHEYTFFFFFCDPALRDRTWAELNLVAFPNVTPVLVPYRIFSPINQLCLPGLLKKLNLDVFHSPNYMVPLLAFPRHRTGRPRCVVTLHDLIPLLFPDYAPRAWKRRFFPVFKQLMREVGARADRVIAVSQCSRQDVARHMDVPNDRIAVIPEGVSPRYMPAPNRIRSDARTVLFVGRPDPYKNLVGLIEAFASLREQCQFPVTLRLVGALDARYPEGPKRAQSLNLGDAAVWTGYLTDEQLLQEYQNADVFVLPSLYEGFGLPVLEAMACGAPVICSNKGSLPEVAGDAALKVQPQDRIGLTEAMRRVLTDSRLARELSNKGIQHAAKFTWQETVRQTLAAYAKVCL